MSEIAPRQLSTPVLLVIFNRPDSTARVLEAVRAARPERLYVAADGPRPDRPDESQKTEEARAVVLNGVDWPCEVRTLFRDRNIGVKKAVGGGIDWFFENEERGIILEDDCLPDASFFPFCEQLLDRYREDDRVMHIGGNCHLHHPPDSPSYFFSKYPHIWGWATWRESWKNFSTTSANFEEEFSGISDLYSSRREKNHWHRVYRKYFNGGYDSWAYGWTFSVWRAHGLAVYPTVNLVKNIGFGNDAVNTKGWRDFKGLRNARLESIATIEHPPAIELDRDLDLQNFNDFFRRPPLPIRAILIGFRLVGQTFQSILARVGGKSGHMPGS